MNIEVLEAVDRPLHFSWGKGPEIHAPSFVKDGTRSIHGVAIALMVVGVLLTAGLVIAASSAHASNEARLLRQRTREAASVLTVAVPGIQTPLASAAELTEATNGQDSAAFERLMTSQLKDGARLSRLLSGPLTVTLNR